MAHTFNLRTREVKTGRDIPGWREEYKVGGERSSQYSVCGLVDTGSPIQPEDSVYAKASSYSASLIF